MAHDGVFKCVRMPHFQAQIIVAPGRVAGLGHLDEFLWWTRPKIPARRLEAILRHAQLTGLSASGMVWQSVEAMYHLHWWAESQEWRVAVPRQASTTGQVMYHGGNEASVVLDLHSHHQMAADFSGIDDRDEQGCRLYAVIGRIYSRPEIRVRVGVYGDFMPVDALDIFEGLGPFVEAG